MEGEHALIVLMLLALGIGPPPPAAPRAARAPSTAGADFRFARLDHAYSQPVVAAPIVRGALSVRLASPRNKIILRSHRLRLAPTYRDGSYAAELQVEFFGKGELTADVDLAGHGRRFQEEVVVPPQRKVLGGRVRVARAQGGGYLVTPLSLPRTIEVEIRSRLADDVVGLCQTLAAVPFSSLDCDGLDRALSTAVVPLPPAGEPFRLAPHDMTAVERQKLEGFLTATAARGRSRRP